MKKLVDIAGRDVTIEGTVLRIARVHGDSYRYEENPERVVAGLRALAERVDVFTFTQRLTEPAPRYPYPMEWDNLAAQQVTTFDHWWRRQVDAKTRNMVRKAEKKGIRTLEVELDSELVAKISRIYNETPIRQGRPFPHFGKSLEEIYAEEATHIACSVFIGAFLEDQLVGFAKLVFDEKETQAGLMNILSLYAQRDKAPQNALIAQAVRSAITRGAKYLVYARFSYGGKQQDGLIEFKQNNGFEKVMVPRYYVGLSATGRVAIRLRMYRGVTAWVPESVAGGFRSLRRHWYARYGQSTSQRTSIT